LFAAFQKVVFYFIRQKFKIMPLTKKGRKVKKTMEKTYGKKKGERVFYATENKGKIKGIARKRKK